MWYVARLPGIPRAGRQVQRIVEAAVVVELGLEELLEGARAARVDVVVAHHDRVRPGRQRVHRVAQPGGFAQPLRVVRAAARGLEVHGVDVEVRTRARVPGRPHVVLVHQPLEIGGDVEGTLAEERQPGGLVEEPVVGVGAVGERHRRPLTGLEHVQHVGPDRVHPGLRLHLLAHQDVGAERPEDRAVVRPSCGPRVPRVVEQVPVHEAQGVRGHGREQGDEKKHGQYDAARETHGRTLGGHSGTPGPGCKRPGAPAGGGRQGSGASCRSKPPLGYRLDRVRGQRSGRGSSPGRPAPGASAGS